MDFLVVFFLACFIEVCSTAYSIFIAKDKYLWAFVVGRVLSLLNVLIIIGVIQNYYLLIPNELGGAIGEAATLRLATLYKNVLRKTT